MRIAFINAPSSCIFPPERSGPDQFQIWCINIARRLQPGHETVIYCGNSRAARIQEVREGDVLHTGIPISPDKRLIGLLARLYRRFGRGRNALPFYASRLYYPVYALLTALDLRKRRADIIHIMNFSNFVPVIRFFNPRSIIVLHMHYEWLSQLDPAVIEKRITKTDYILGCSDYIARKIRNRFPDTAARCFTLWNGTDTDIFGPDRHGGEKTSGNHRLESPDRRVNLLYVARISPEKGLHILIEAFRTIRDKYPQARLEIIGAFSPLPWDYSPYIRQDEMLHDLQQFYNRPTPDRIQTYRKYLERIILPEFRESVIFRGPVPNNELPSYYRNADLFIYPSIWNEPFGTSVIEAMASGVPVICSRSGGIVEILEEGLHGMLAERNDPVSLANGVMRVLASPELYVRYRNEGIRQAREIFSWDRTARTLMAIYRLGKTGGGRKPPFAAEHQPLPVLRLEH